MYKNKTNAVVVRAYNEEKSISSLVDSMPDFVDRIYIVNDASSDKTLEIISELARTDKRIFIINHSIRSGAGSASISGLKQTLLENIDVVATMDGDGQMIPSLLSRFLDPIIMGKADCSKGSRLLQREDKREMPTFRLFGNFMLTYLTRMASGYWHISDPQNGYMAISQETLRKIDLDNIDRGFAFENDILVKLNVVNARVVNIPHPAIYRGQTSKITYPSFILQTSWILLKDFAWRLSKKYLFKKQPTN
jgi:glycosyltransferase involved in cell wall biosynthesis